MRITRRVEVDGVPENAARLRDVVQEVPDHATMYIVTDARGDFPRLRWEWTEDRWIEA